MILFDFEQSTEKSILTLSGSLKKDDAEDLKRLLINWLRGNSKLIIDLHGVTEVSLPCREVFTVVHNQFLHKGKEIIFIGKSKEEIMSRI